MASVGAELDGRDWTVRGLRLPDHLIALLDAGRWHEPQDSVLRAVLPWFEDPLSFLSDLDEIQRENRALDRLVDDEKMARVFRLSRGSRVSHAMDLP